MRKERDVATPAGIAGERIAQVEISTGEDQYVDLEKQAFAMLARE